MPIIILVFSVAIFALILFIVVVAVRWHKKAMQSLAKELGTEELQSGKRYKSQVEGMDYEYQYYAGSRNSPSYFEIYVPLSSKGTFELGRENKFDRFFKNIGIALEIQTGDMVFDEKIYIKSNAPEFAMAYFNDVPKRQAAVKLFDTGFNALKCNGEVLALRKSPVDLKKDIKRQIIDDAVRQLAVLTRDLPEYYPEPTMPGVSAWKARRNLVFFFTVVLFVAGLAAVIFGSVSYPPLDGWDVFVYSLKFSVPAFFVFAGIAGNMLKGRSSSHYELIGVLLAMLIGLPCLACGSALIYNGYTDTGTVALHHARVVDKWINRSKDSTTYYVRVESWRVGKGLEKFRVSQSLYNALTINLDVMDIQTKPGRLGFEWVVSKQKGSTQNP